MMFPGGAANSELQQAAADKVKNDISRAAPVISASKDFSSDPVLITGITVSMKFFFISIDEW